MAEIEVNDEMRQEFKDFLVELQTLNFLAAKAVVSIDNLNDAVRRLPWWARILVVLRPETLIMSILTGK